MTAVPQPQCPAVAAITSGAPMVHVADVDRSVEFYTKLGFECVSRFSGHDGRTNWADLESKAARIMLARASGPVDAEVQAVLFYLYSANVRLLQQHLLEQGIPHAGPPPQEGIESPPPNGAAVFDIVPRFYMPAGELRLHDPDGYCLLVGQLD
jgi:catechol 2,3-dioxygenase-like lactoylglutathione lyase family enzyme